MDGEGSGCGLPCEDPLLIDGLVLEVSLESADVQTFVRTFSVVLGNRQLWVS